jgi:hypothetical protein
MLDDGQDLGAPDGILINGRAPYRYDSALVPDGLQYETVGVEPGWLWSNFYLQICSSMCNFYKIESYTHAECSKLCLYASYISNISYFGSTKGWILSVTDVKWK